MEQTYIIGHKNPDVDSICSAVSYANFKKAIGVDNCIAARCGNSNLRIDKVLARFNTPLPMFVGDMRMRAKDIMKTRFTSLPINASCFEVMDAIDKHDLRAIPLVDSQGKLCGEVSVFDMGEFFMPRTTDNVKSFRHLKASLNDIIKTLNAKANLVFRQDEIEDMYGRIGAMEVSTFGKFIETEDSRPEQNLIVVGDRFDIQIKAIQMGVRGLIITGGYDIDESVFEMAKAKQVSIISCNYDSATTSLLVRMATSAQKLMRKDVASISPDKLLSKISTRTKELNKIIFVCSSEGILQGVFSSVDLLDVSKPKLIMVDHNELSQAGLGANEAEIIEIVDH
ncbi:MAG: DHH family phosphoesterase, partial [Opitutales bacterium]|nr:DHH family phosphoesterase [Opitutales bacterium]